MKTSIVISIGNKGILISLIKRNNILEKFFIENFNAETMPIVDEFFKKYKKKKSFDPLYSLLTLDSKKRSSTLKSIENNIEDNFENLNNPQQFYQKTFSLIKEKKKTINKRLDNIYNFIMHCNSMGI